MRLLALLAWLVVVPAHAELYRWIDPDTGSVKFSSLPPYDPRVTAELVPYKGPAQPPAAALEAMAAAAKPKPPAGSLGALEARWSELLTQLTGVAPQDFQRASEGLRQHMEAYESVRAELDRLDPAGAARRRNESQSLIERVKQGFAAQFSPTPPGQQKK
jgi:hypothetical protein